MHYSIIKDNDVANGLGIRVTLFVSGCTNACEGCFQPETWDFNYGQPVTSDVWDDLFEKLKPDYIRGLTILGGEPMEPKNQRDLLPFLTKYREIYPTKDLWIFTGFTYDKELTNKDAYPYVEGVTEKILDMVDVLVDGRFVLAKKNLSLTFRGSSNQRIIDVRRTRTEGHIVSWNEVNALS